MLCLLHLLLISCPFSDNTPLHYAASEHGDSGVDVVQLLLSCNAAVDARGKGYQPYSFTVDAVDENALLIFCCVVPPTFALISCSFSDCTPLHLAASNSEYDYVDVVQLLLSCNAAVDARDRRYRPYHCIVDSNALLILCCVVPPTFCVTICS
jgi:hypothetical protein